MSRARPALTVCATLLLGAALLAAPLHAQQAPPSPDDALRARLAGTFVPAPGHPNRTQLEAGVDRAVAALFALIRPIARSRILDGNPLFPQVTFTFAGRRIEVLSPPIHARSLDDGVPWSVIGLDHNPNNVTHRLQGDALVQTCWNSAGRRVTRFVPSTDGTHLGIHVEVTAPQLPVAVRYSLEFVRR